MNKLFSRIFMIFMVLGIVAMMTFGAGPMPSADAELAKEKRVTLSGVNLSTATGNATGAQTGVNVAESWGYPDKYTCYSFMTLSNGTTINNTATWALEASYDNSFWNSLASTSILASDVGLTTSSNFGTAKYLRANVTAIVNANSYVNVQCIFQ